MPLLVNDVLQSVSFALIERQVFRVFPAGIAAGVRTVALVDRAIYVGAQLVAGYKTVNQEVVVVTGITANDFTATYVNPHLINEPIVGATFPSGQIIQDLIGSISAAATVSPLFTQAEMLKYLTDTQNTFLETTRMLYAESAQNLTQGLSVYTAPDVAVRIERISIAGSALWNVSQGELDLDNPAWQGVAGAGNPTQWFQDRMNTAQYYLASPPPPAAPPPAKLWHSVKNPILATLADTLLIPGIFGLYIKYGILEKAWSKDGETRDPRRAAYCGKRFMRGIKYSAAIMQAIQADVNFNR